MKNNILISLFIILIIVSCNSERTKNDKIIKELEQGEINSREFSKIFENKALILKTNNSIELTEIASKIYSHIGIPVTSQDTQRLDIAIEYLDKALECDPLNRSAYRNKVNILTSMQEWDRAIEAVNHWLIRGKPYYYDYMIKGFIYEVLELKDSSITSFNLALAQFEQNKYEKEDV